MLFSVHQSDKSHALSEHDSFFSSSNSGLGGEGRFQLESFLNRKYEGDIKESNVNNVNNIEHKSK